MAASPDPNFMNVLDAAAAAASPEAGSLHDFFDRQAIMDLVRLERFYRDQGMWDELDACYTDDATVRTTWFDGTARDFVIQSRAMHENGIRGKHVIAPTFVKLNGDRAISESPSAILLRYNFDGIEADMTQICRFFSRVVRTPKGWRLRSFEGIYIKDTLVPVNPADVLPLDWEAIAKLRPSYRFLGLGLARAGYKIPQHLVGDDRPDILQAFYKQEYRWLETGSG